ncbi:MAG: DUF3830 family protein [Opitutus sp.]|nr:DUF3830 family protein [Opitutus sp.]
MKSNRRHVRLTFPATGVSLLAELLDDEAPNVCELVWKMLPVETKVIHGMYSGFEVFALVDQPGWCRACTNCRASIPATASAGSR